MKIFLLKFLAEIPAATLLYILLVLFSKLAFSFHWLFFAVMIDIIDWFVSKAS